MTTASGRERYTPFIYSDEPLDGATAPAFQFAAYADTLAYLIAAKKTRTPLTIGVFGDWGMGKTTLMQAIKYRLDGTEGIENGSPIRPFLAPGGLAAYRRCHTVWFNAWKYSEQPDGMMAALMAAILRQMHAKGFIDELKGTITGSKSDPTRPTYKLVEAALNAAVFALSVGQADFDLTKFQKESRVVTLRPFLDEFQTHFDRLLLWYLRPRGAAGPNTEAEGKDERKNLDQQGVLVVFIDDLDRCLPNKAVQTLEAIKLIIGQPGVVFVLGASEEAVKAAIRTHFEAIKYIEAGGDSQQYLEKLIQVPFALPRPEEHDLGLYIENLLAQNPDKATVKTLQATLPLIVKGVPTNPRRLKTFLNTVELEWGFLVNAEQKGSLSKDALARWLAICAAEPRFAATVAQLPRASQLPFVLDAQRLMRGEKLEDESKARQYDNWSRDTCPRLWQLLAHAQLSFNMTPADFGTLISLRAPIVQAVEPDRAPAKPADVEPLAPRSGRAQRVGPGGDWPAWLPPLLRVPKGEFLMGSDKAIDSLARDNEMPQHREAIALPYLIGQFPVTNADFMRFAEANKTFKTAAEAPKHPGGYVWTGSEWKQVKGANWQRPQGGTSTIAERMDHPVVHVNWRDALAYCQWLNEMLASLMKDKADSLPEALAKLLAESQATHLMARLPTEAEWEKAARGDDGRLWPWGNQFDEKKCNTAEGGKGGTTPVGAYSQAGGDSPYGCADVAGNVWEWCSTKWRENYKAKADDTLEGDSSRVLRGGSFFNNRDYARCAYRSWYVPDFVFNSIGFRVVVAPGQ